MNFLLNIGISVEFFKVGAFLENELTYQIKKSRYDNVIFSKKSISKRIFNDFFEKNKNINEIITSNSTEALSVALGIYLSGKKSLVVLSKSALMNAIGVLNDLKIKEIPVPIFLGEKFEIFAEPMTELKIRRILRGINIPFFELKKDNLKKIEDLIKFSEVIKAPVVFCVENRAWGT